MIVVIQEEQFDLVLLFLFIIKNLKLNARNFFNKGEKKCRNMIFQMILIHFGNVVSIIILKILRKVSSYQIRNYLLKFPVSQC